MHRIGRTGRRGKKGVAHSIIYDINQKCAKQLIKILQKENLDVPQELMYYR